MADLEEQNIYFIYDLCLQRTRLIRVYLLPDQYPCFIIQGECGHRPIGERVGMILDKKPKEMAFLNYGSYIIH